MSGSFKVLLLLIFIPLTAISQRDTIVNQLIECRESEWELVFSDEFDGSRLNYDKWITWYPYTDDGSDQCAFCRTHGNEGQVFVDSNVVVSDGSLKLIAKKEDTVWMGEKRAYSSGMIHSHHAFGHGRYEVKARLPEGTGFWPAIWTFGQIYTEIDLMEAGMQHAKRFHTSIHNWNIRKMAHRRHKIRSNLAEDYHVYSMEWDSTFIKFFIDDKQVWQFSALTKKNGKNINKCPIRPGRYLTEPIFPDPNEKLYLIIGLAVGNEQTPFTKSPDERTIFPNQMEVDYIRYYQKKRD